LSAPPRRRPAINVTQSARAGRETHIGTLLPEPVDIEAYLAHSAKRAEAFDRAALVFLEHVSPIERAAYVPREAFDHRLPANVQSARDQRGK
jgi:RNA polymerase sigma-70 factor, ECF subfamily